MCGLFGWQLSPEALQQGDVKVLAAILAVNSDRRGDESWGVVMVDGTNKPVMLKNIGSIRRTCRIHDIIAPQVIGHTRKATTGAVTVQNAHPFAHGTVIGAHNGFVYDHTPLNKQFNRAFEVDSQHLIAHIAEKRELTELSGMGTVTYIDTNDQQVVHIGRGAGSDLAVYGLGPRNKPYGVVWCSIASWLTEALDMAGFRDHYPFITHLRTEYQVKDYNLEEVGNFPFGQSSSRITTIYSNDTRELNCGQNGPTCGVPNRGYRGRTYFDEREYHTQKQLPPAKGISKHDLDELPESLKKNPQESDLADRESKKAHASTFQCDACSDWGRLVANYKDDVEGIVYHSSINQHLCFECAVYWGDETKSPLKTPATRVPTLDLKGGYL